MTTEHLPIIRNHGVPGTQRAWAIAGLAGLTGLSVRKKLLDWGATSAEIHGALPGDELLERANLTSTRAITIARPAADVWRWIAQLGQGRGGFYSYDALENLVGCEIRSAVRIVPELQKPIVGEEIHLHPDAALIAAVVDPGRALVLSGSVPIGRTPPFDFTWAFTLADEEPGACRLVVRERYRYRRWFAGLIVEPTEIISFIMSQKMLRGIRHRAVHHDARRWSQRSQPCEDGAPSPTR